MATYKLSNVAKEDLIRIHQFGVERFGVKQADKYLSSFFDYFELIAQQAFAFEAVDFLKKGYCRFVSGVDSIYYRVEYETVEVMAIVGRQDLKNIF